MGCLIPVGGLGCVVPNSLIIDPRLTWNPSQQSSITLVGELLFKITGISGKNEIEEDEPADVALAESSKRALVDILGKERRDRILSALFIARQDSVNVVRQSSIHIWKALVHNTPRTGKDRAQIANHVGLNISLVREILPELIDQLIKLVSSEEFEQQEVRCHEIGTCFPLKLYRPPPELPRNCAKNPERRCWQRSSWFSRSALRLKMQGQEPALVCCLRSLCMRSPPLSLGVL